MQRKVLQILICLLTFFMHMHQDGTLAFARNTTTSIMDTDSFLRANGYYAWTVADYCFNTDKVMFLDSSETNTVAVPESFSEQSMARFNSSNTPDNTTSLIGQLTPLIAMLAGPQALLLVGWAAGEFLAMTDMCTNALVVPAYEIANEKSNCMKCNFVDNLQQFKLAYLHAYGPEDIPYRYHCDTTLTNEGIYHRGYGGYLNDNLCGVFTNNGQNPFWTRADFNKVKFCYQSGYRKLALIGLNKLAGLVTGQSYEYQYCDSPQASLNQSGSYSESYTGSKSGGLDQHMSFDPAPECVEWEPGSHGAYTVYYRNNPSTQIVEMCIANVATFFPVRLGCEPIAPPPDTKVYDSRLRNYTGDTRCEYLNSQRSDLITLGQTLPLNDATGMARPAVLAFLQGEIHFFSTVTGCVEDLLSKVILGNRGNPSNETSLIKAVSDTMRPILYATLALYFTLFGFKVITFAQSIHKPAEWLKNIFKVGCVVYFSSTAAWYDPKPDGTDLGLYTLIMSSTDVMRGIILSSFAGQDPLGHCTYYYTPGHQLLTGQDVPATMQLNHSANKSCIPQQFPFGASTSAYKPVIATNTTVTNADICGGPIQDKNILSQIGSYQVSSVVDTQNGCGPNTVRGQTCKSQKANPGTIKTNYNVIHATAGAIGAGGACVARLTSWDMVDCMLANILTLGLCNYSTTFLILVWIIPIGLISSGGFVVAISALIFLFCTLSIMFRFVMVGIMAMCGLTLFIMMAPIFIIFILFERTKGIFEQWVKYIIGWAIYPAILFAYIVLIMLSINSVMFGDIKEALVAKYGPDYYYNPGLTVDYRDLCQNSTAASTAFCKTMNILKANDPCVLRDNNIQNGVLIKQDSAFFSMHKISPDYSNAIQNSLLQMMFLSLLFSMLSGAMMSFIAQVTGLYGMGFVQETAVANKVSVSNAMSGIAKIYNAGGEKAIKGAYNALASKNHKTNSGDS